MTDSHAKIKVSGQLVQKIEWKQTPGWMDEHDNRSKLTLLAIGVG